MTNQLNLLVTTEWLFPVLKEQLMTLHNKLKLSLDVHELALVADEYHRLYDTFKVARLATFANLALMIESTFKAIGKEQLSSQYIYKSLYASNLLLNELTFFVQTGSYHKALIVEHQKKLQDLLVANHVWLVSQDHLLVIENEAAVPNQQPLSSTFMDDVPYQTVNSCYLYKYIELPEDIENVKLSSKKCSMLLTAWRYSLNSLFSRGSQNDDRFEVCLTYLQKVVHYLINDAYARNATERAKLWYVVKQWLASLPVNNVPVSAYTQVLANLESLICAQCGVSGKTSIVTDDYSASPNSVSHSVSHKDAETCLIDIYIHLSSLSSLTKQAEHVLASINSGTEYDHALLPRVMLLINLAIEQLESQQEVEIVLKDVQSQLMSRGWRQLSQQVEEIIDQCCHPANDSSNSIATEALHSLYSTIENIYKMIDLKVGQQIASYSPPLYKKKDKKKDKSINYLDNRSITNRVITNSSVIKGTRLNTDLTEPASLPANLNKASITDVVSTPSLYEARIALDNIKNAYRDYLYHHDAQLLNNTEPLAKLRQLFSVMLSDDLTAIVVRLKRLFENIFTYDLNRITWVLAENITDSLALLELFMDFLALHTFDSQLLKLISDRMIVAESLVIQLIDDPDIEKSDWATLKVQRLHENKNVIHYDDNGEITLNDATTHVVSTTPQESESLNALKDSLKEDTFDMDEVIRDVFVEEANEVFEALDKYLPEWQADSEDTEALSQIRRGFHTLEGSGRMVGAHSASDIACVVESMLNRILDKTISVTEEMIGFIGESHTHVQILVNDFANQRPASIDTALVIFKAKNLLKGRPINEGVGELNPNNAEFMTTQCNDSLIVMRDKTIENEGRDRVQQSKATTHDVQLNQAYESNNERNEPNLPDVLRPYLANAIIAKDTSDADQDIKDIFVEEAGEVLDEIIPQFNQWKGARDRRYLIEVRRGFHTLKGSGRMVGANYSAEVAWAIENMLNRILDNTIEPTSDMQLLIEDVLESYPAMLSAFEHGTDNYPEKMPLWIACANAFSKNLQSQFDYQTVMANYHSTEYEVDFTVDEPVKALVNNELTEKKSDEKGEHICLIDRADYDSSNLKNSVDLDCQQDQEKQVSSTELSATPRQLEDIEFEQIGTEPELLAFFLEEAQEIDDAISAIFSAWSQTPTDVELLEVLQRHLHTIKGGARMAGIRSIADLAHEAETLYENFLKGHIQPSRQWVEVMQGVQDILTSQVQQVLLTGNSYYANHTVDQLRSLAKSKEIDENFALCSPKITQTKDAKTVALPIQNSALLNEQSANISSKDLTSEEHSESLSKLARLDNKGYLNDQTTVQLDFNRLKLESWHGNEPDSDILSIFLEEAQELIDSSTQHMQSFYKDPNNKAALKELQREFHTMKGGARMVSANGVADLTHYMETLLESLLTQNNLATTYITRLLLACQDWLTQAILLLRKGVNPPTPSELIEGLKCFYKDPDILLNVPKSSLHHYIEATNNYEKWRSSRSTQHDISTIPSSSGNFGKPDNKPKYNNEMTRVSSGLMEHMINLSGESAINRARIDMNIASLNNTVDEMAITVSRLADQLRRMDIELEAQILSQINDKDLLDNEAFDPLEMDQYSSFNQLSKSLSESASDLLDLKNTMRDKTRNSEDLLLQLSRTHTDLQDALMSSRMVPFSRLIPRLQRIVRQTAKELGKEVELEVINADDEMDRIILERITSPLEHMLRNAVDHGIELPQIRETLGKLRKGRIILEVTRDGSEVVIKLSDDGSGIDIEAVRAKAISQGLIDEKDDTLTELDVMQYVFNAGLTTTNKLTQISGRGVGMDVVRSEIRQLGGTVSVNSKPNRGSVFSMRVPLTVAISDALRVRVADQYYAIPLMQIERVERVNAEALIEFYQSERHTFKISGRYYRLRYLDEMLSGVSLNVATVNTNISLPVIIINNQTGQNLAIQVDEVIGSRIEVVVKPLGRQLTHISALSAATIMGDGSVMLILDALALMRNAPIRQASTAHNVKENTKGRPQILIVDDSVTVRKVTSRLLERQGFDTHVARDGLDAIEMLQSKSIKPDLMLLDIEMPRMDGFEVATHIRQDSQFKNLPIIMITSRTGDKHKQKAIEIGVNGYMGKPFEDTKLINVINGIIDVVGECSDQ